MTQVLQWLGVLLASTLFQTEATSLLARFQRGLVRLAARQIGRDQRARWEEEWLGELSAVSPGPVAGTTFVVSIFFHAQRIARTLRPSTSSQMSTDLDDRKVAIAALVIFTAIVLVIAGSDASTEKRIRDGRAEADSLASAFARSQGAKTTPVRWFRRKSAAVVLVVYLLALRLEAWRFARANPRVAKN
jgi:hypothetical protein